MPNRTLYIRAEDIPTWQAAENAAWWSRRPLSQFVTRLIREHLDHCEECAKAPTPNTD